MRIRMAVRMGVCGLLLGLAVGAKRGPNAGGGDGAGQGPLPDPVKKAVDDHCPGAKVVGYEHVVEDKRNLYFVDLKTEKGAATLLSSGKGQYLGMVSEMPGDDDADVYIEYETAPQAVKDVIAKTLTNGADEKAGVTVDALFMEVEQERFMFVAEQGGDSEAPAAGGEGAATRPKGAKGGGVGAKWWTFSLGGNLVSMEKEIANKDLPGPVREGIKGKILSASEVDDKEKKSKTYVVDVAGAGGAADQEVTFSPDGTVVSTEAVEADTKP